MLVALSLYHAAIFRHAGQVSAEAVFLSGFAWQYRWHLSNTWVRLRSWPSSCPVSSGWKYDSSLAAVLREQRSLFAKSKVSPWMRWQCQPLCLPLTLSSYAGSPVPASPRAGLPTRQELHLSIQGAWGRPRCTAASTATFSSSVFKHPPTPRCLVLIRPHHLPSLLLERWQFSLHLPQLLLFLPQLLHLSQDGVLSFPPRLLSTEESEIMRSSSAAPVCCGFRCCTCYTTIVHTDGRLPGTWYLRAVLLVQMRPRWRTSLLTSPQRWLIILRGNVALHCMLDYNRSIWCSMLCRVTWCRLHVITDGGSSLQSIRPPGWLIRTKYVLWYYVCTSWEALRLVGDSKEHLVGTWGTWIFSFLLQIQRKTPGIKTCIFALLYFLFPFSTLEIRNAVHGFSAKTCAKGMKNWCDWINRLRTC